MKKSSQAIVTLLLAVNLISFPFCLQAVEIDPSKNIFRFQQKLALGGNSSAQYQLASMYETGDGTAVNIEQAKYWYDQSSKKGNKAGQDRAIYLVIKKRGFDQAKDGEWLAGVKNDSENKKSEATLLLGQLYHKGIGVHKDLNKSLALYSRVNAIGAVNADKEIAAVEAEMLIATSSKALITEKASKKRVYQVKPAKVQAVTIKAKVNELTRAEKKKKYDAVMLKLKIEQEQIDAQQSWATGGSVAVVDDEI